MNISRRSCHSECIRSFLVQVFSTFVMCGSSRRSNSDLWDKQRRDDELESTYVSLEV